MFAVDGQIPELGRNVYVVVDVLFIGGDQAPTIPLFDVNGKAAIVVPAQTVATCVNVGVTPLEFTVIVIVVLVAQNPVVGVNVYVMVAVLLITGNQDPA